MGVATARTRRGMPVWHPEIDGRPVLTGMTVYTRAPMTSVKPEYESTVKIAMARPVW